MASPEPPGRSGSSDPSPPPSAPASSGWGGQPVWSPAYPVDAQSVLASPPLLPARPDFPHAEPREYHQMLRTWTYSWWRPSLGIVLLLVGAIVVVPLVTLPVLVLGVLLQGDGGDLLGAVQSAGTFETVTPAGLLYLNLSLAGLILWSWLLIRFLHQMRPRWLTSVVPKMRWSLFGTCLGFAFLALIAQLVVSALVPESAAPPLDHGVNELTGRLVAMALIVLLTTPLQAAGEEYAFRGYLLQSVGSLTRSRWAAVLVTSTLFALAHGLQNFPLFFDRFMFGFIAGWLVILTGGLEAGLAMHVLNNYLAIGSALAFGDLTSTLGVSEVSWWNIPVTLTQSGVYAVLVLWWTRRRRLQTTTRPPGYF